MMPTPETPTNTEESEAATHAHAHPSSHERVDQTPGRQALVPDVDATLGADEPSDQV